METLGLLKSTETGKSTHTGTLCQENMGAVETEQRPAQMGRRTVKNAVLWDVMWSGSCKNRRFRLTYRLHHQGDKNRRARNNVSSN
jgi:hypothetical protein